MCVFLDSGTDAPVDAPPDALADGGKGIAVEVVESGTGGSPLAFSITPGTSANRLLVVGASWAPNGLKATSVSVMLGSSLLQEQANASW